MSELWVEKYRPKSVEECILPDDIKTQVQGLVSGGDIPHLLFAGSAGTGKTSLGLAIAADLDCDFTVYNGSDGSLNLDELRENVRDFAQTVSIDANASHKIIIIDEADGLSRQIQGALRNAMEKYAGTCRFILTANYPDKIISPIQSRCSKIDFQFNQSDASFMARGFARRIAGILNDEGIQYEPNAVIDLCKMYFPDARKMINEVNRVCFSSKVFNKESLKRTSIGQIGILFDAVNSNDFDGVKEWVANNTIGSIFNMLYRHCEDHISKDNIPTFIHCIADYQKHHYTVPNQELNLLGALNEYMGMINA